MRKVGRYEIRKAATKGVQVRVAEGPKDWQVLWELTHETGQRRGIDVPSLEKIEAMRCFAEANPLHCTAMISCLEGRPIAAAAVLRHGSTVTPEVAGSSSAPIKGVSKFLPVMWESVRWAKETGASLFDVGGIASNAPKGSALWRINMFKRQLSGKELELFRPMEKVFHPAFYKAYTLLRRSKHKALGRYRSIVNRAT
jgi:lipid II:glycine glycyltransferase (peptidoglycan interpeptide bridge formation enzyme)